VIARAPSSAGVALTVSGPVANTVNFTGTDYIATFKASGCLGIVDSDSVTGTSFDYLVVAGGGSGGFSNSAGGGGGGGHRTSFPGGTKLILSPGPHAVTVGAGGASVSTPSTNKGNSGTESRIGNIFASGGGAGGSYNAGANDGGSGGGKGTSAGSGNIIATAPSQGNPGGGGPGGSGNGDGGGGGGGAGAAGSDGSGSAGGAGGNGVANSITNSSVTRAGGGGGGRFDGSAGAAGSGGGTAGGTTTVSSSAAVNTGGGSGGSGGTSGPATGQGGSGIVVLRAPGPTGVSVAPGTNTIATLPAPEGGCKVATFTVSGTLTIS
jgi:hypothetical protein